MELKWAKKKVKEVKENAKNEKNEKRKEPEKRTKRNEEKGIRCQGGVALVISAQQVILTTMASTSTNTSSFIPPGP